MKLTKLASGILFNVLIALLVAQVFSFSPCCTLVVISILMILQLFIPQIRGVAFMAVQREIWERDIVENLFKNNQFASRAYSADEYVVQGKVVHIPIAGAPNSVVKNPTSFPLTASERTDADVFYNLDLYATNPTKIANIDKYELSYDKRQSVLGSEQANLRQQAMDGLLYNWSPGASNVILTDGTATPATASGATGNRLAFSKDLFDQVKLNMDNANIPDDGRVVLLTANHYSQLLKSFSDVEATGFHALADRTKGIIGEYLGFQIMKRSTVQRYRLVSSVWTPVDITDPGFATSTQTGDSAASLFYYDQAVERALGDVEMFERINDPLYLGDVYGFSIRIGGRVRRLTGVYAAVEAPSA